MQRRVMAGHFVGRKQRVSYHARKRSQLQMHSRDLDAALLGFFLRQVDDAHRDGKFVHDFLVGRRICSYSRLAQTDAAVIWRYGVISPDRNGATLE